MPEFAVARVATVVTSVVLVIGVGGSLLCTVIPVAWHAAGSTSFAGTCVAPVPFTLRQSVINPRDVWIRVMTRSAVWICNR